MKPIPKCPNVRGNPRAMSGPELEEPSVRPRATLQVRHGGPRPSLADRVPPCASSTQRALRTLWQEAPDPREDQVDDWYVIEVVA